MFLYMFSLLLLMTLLLHFVVCFWSERPLCRAGGHPAERHTPCAGHPRAHEDPGGRGEAGVGKGVCVCVDLQM